MIFLDLLCFLDPLLASTGVNFNLKLYSLLSNASWKGFTASLKTVSLAEMLLSLLFTDIGMFLIMLGGWLLLECTYRGVLLGFMNGLKMPLLRFMLISRKSTDFMFAVMVIFKLFSLKIPQIFFFSNSTCIGLAEDTVSPSSRYRPTLMFRPAS